MLKIEGIIRDIIALSNIKYLYTTKSKIKNNDENKKIVECSSINTLIWEKEIFELIPENDVWFLRWFLVDGLGIRNNIAHALHLSIYEYNDNVMHYLIIIILRLCRFKIVPK